MAEDREPLSPLEALDRYGWPSEMLGPVPRPGGPACAYVAARVTGFFRAWDDQRADIAATRAATLGDDGGDISDLKRVLARLDREIADQEHYARSDVAAIGEVEPSRQGRIDALRARRQHLRALAMVGYPPPLI